MVPYGMLLLSGEMCVALLAWTYNNQTCHTGHAVDYAFYGEIAIEIPHWKAILHVFGMSWR